MMMNWKSKRRLAVPVLFSVFRVVLGVLLLYAGITKVADPSALAQAVHNYRLLPLWMITPVAIVLPWVEIVVGVSLLLGVYTQGGALLASGLMGIFLLALAISLVRGLDISCGCFGPSGSAKPITFLTLLRDFLLMAMGICVYFFQQGRRRIIRRTGSLD
jgi:putative oxidoreductase